MTDSELRDELFTMLGAGHETTATGLAFAFELLLRDPPVLARLREELADGDDDSYLDAVVKETLRLRPVLDAAERTLTVPRRVAGWDLGRATPAARSTRPDRPARNHARTKAWRKGGHGVQVTVEQHTPATRARVTAVAH
jgi:hypothetical protein